MLFISDSEFICIDKLMIKKKLFIATDESSLLYNRKKSRFKFRSLYPALKHKTKQFRIEQERHENNEK